MALNNAAKHVMLNAFAAVATYVAAMDGSTSGDESGSARKSITWNSAADGNLDSSNTPVIDMPPGSSVTHIGLFSAETSGTFYGAIPVDTETFTNAGTYTVSDFDIPLEDPE